MTSAKPSVPAWAVIMRANILLLSTVRGTALTISRNFQHSSPHAGTQRRPVRGVRCNDWLGVISLSPANQNRRHGDGAYYRAVEEVKALAFVMQGKGVEQRVVMLWGRYRELRTAPEHLVGHQRLVIPRHNALLDFFVTVNGPVQGLRIVKAEHTQVMNDVPAPENQHTFVAQRTQRLGKRIVKGTRPGRFQAQLHDGNVRLRIHRHQDAPCTMIQPSIRVQAWTYRADQF